MSEIIKKPVVLFEDNHIIVVVKPANMLVQGDNTGDEDVLTWLKAYIKEKYNKPGDICPHQQGGLPPQRAGAHPRTVP